MVNRIWHYHFGQGIVGTPSDFGRDGSAADASRAARLAGQRVRPAAAGASRGLHRLIVTSNTYRQSSALNASDAAEGRSATTSCSGDSRAQRLEGEVIRDSALLVSGLLNRRWADPACYPELPAGMPAPRGGWKLVDGRGTQPPQRIHLRAAQHALSDVRSLRHAGHARKLRAGGTRPSPLRRL